MVRGQARALLVVNGNNVRQNPAIKHLNVVGAKDIVQLAKIGSGPEVEVGKPLRYGYVQGFLHISERQLHQWGKLELVFALDKDTVKVAHHNAFASA